MLDLHDIAIPDVYKESADFRFFVDLFAYCLDEVKADIENIPDNYDPLRIKSKLLPLLAESMGFKYDDRLSVAFNRLVLVYFMSLIRNRGSKDGVTLAALVNLDQFNLQAYAKENPALEERLEDTNIPVNMVSVVPHPNESYIDITYFSDKVPLDSCIEYIRPLGMYCFQNAGVRLDARSKISVDAKLTDATNTTMNIGPTRVGQYSRNDYARMQKMRSEKSFQIDKSDSRKKVYGRNSDVEKTPTVDAGYRTLATLQLCNNDHILKSTLEPIFSIGFGPDQVVTHQSDEYLKQVDNKMYNLRLNRTLESSISDEVYTSTPNTAGTDIKPVINPIMKRVGDAMSLNDANTSYTNVQSDGSIDIVSVPDKS